LGIEYDGSNFAGWQSQAHGNTVQDALEAALAAVAGHRVRVACAGRTDAGVHALAQVVHFDCDAVRPESAWVRGVNAHLPPQVAVCWAKEVGTDFHARFSARSRAYRYVLLNRSVRPAVLAGKAGWFHQLLDIPAMREGAALLLGEHDFSAFRAAECQAKSPVKTVYRADISAQDELIFFDFHANAFLHHMIRNIVGCLVYIGKGKHPPTWVTELLVARDRTRAAPTFAADGLYFAGVEYDPCWQLPSAGRIITPILDFPES
jgi:tRNA pseudouridine38-40 synthase